MKATDRTVIAGLAIAGLLAAFWFMVLSPKREEAAKLQDDVTKLETSVSQQEQLAAAAELAQDDFDINYRRLVVLGKAAPEEEDTSSLFVQLEEISKRSHVDLRAIALSEDAGGADATTAPAAAQTTADGAQPADGDAGAAAPVATDPAAPATEAVAAALPIGATVGPAGLPVMPYKLSLNGTFFELADFLAGLDALVQSRDGAPAVQGRLMTIDGFTLGPDESKPLPALSASLVVTTYVTPADQGLTAGATPGGPPAEVPTAATPTPASTTTPPPAP
jgi:Tfp pilus assembly protein PilO